jgi:hypothetical protein
LTGSFPTVVGEFILRSGHLESATAGLSTDREALRGGDPIRLQFSNTEYEGKDGLVDLGGLKTWRKNLNHCQSQQIRGTGD